MSINRDNKSTINNSAQELQNDSFDRDFHVNAVEALVYNEKTGALDRMVQPGEMIPTSGNNASMSIDESDPANVILTKTINNISYQKTITISGTTTTISEWTEI